MTRMMNQIIRWSVPVLALLVSACATTGSGEVAPVEDRGAAAATAPPPMARARIPEAAPRQAPSPAVQALLAQALEASRKGDQAAAVSLLERAQRIQPRNPLVWNRLALVRLQQAEYAQAESLALKSNLYAGTDRDLQLRNWRLIAEARRSRGDAAGAQEAERQARALSAGS